MDWLTIGIVGKPHGLRGGFYVSGRDAAVPSTITKVVVGPRPEAGTALKVAKAQMQSGRPLLMLEGIESREGADAFKGQTIWALRSELGLKAGEYCWADFVGKTVISKDGVNMGKVERVSNYGASDLLEIAHPERGTMMLPLVSSYIAFDFDPQGGEIRLTVDDEILSEAWEAPDATR